MPLLTDWSKGNRSNTAYNNFALCYKDKDWDELRRQKGYARDSGLPESEIRNLDKSASKSNIAHSVPTKSYAKHFKVSKKLLKTAPKATNTDLTAEFNNLPDAKPDHPYLQKKQIKPLGVKQGSNIIYVPFYSHDNPNRVQSWQIIDKQGKKLFKTGASLENAYFCYGKLKSRIYVCEGYATAISVHILTGHRVVASGNKGTLNKTAKLLKAKYPKTQIIVCLDNDGPKTPDIERLKGIEYIKPTLPYGKDKQDYNDYYIDDPESAEIELLSLKQKTTLFNVELNKIVDWLVKGYIPKAVLTLLIGDKGAGKTTYCVSIAVEMILKTGKRVIYYSNENDPVVVIMNIVMEKVKSLYPNASLEEIKEKLNFVRRKFEIFPCETNKIHTHKQVYDEFDHINSNTYCMVIIDPIADIIEDLASNKEARPIMIALRDVAKNTEVPILLTLNRKKNIKETEFIDQGMGAATIPNVARHVLYLKKVKGQDNMSVLFKVASNYDKTDGGMLFSYKYGKDESIGCLETEKVLTESRDDIVEKYITSHEGRDDLKSEKSLRLQKLRELLKKGPRQVSEIIECILQYKEKDCDEESKKRLVTRDLREVKATKSKTGNQVYWQIF